MRTLRLKNVIYFPSFNCVGGVETYCYEMGLKFGKDYDITVLYQNGDADMMKHIAEVARVIRYNPGDKIICDVFIFGWGYDILDNVDAKFPGEFPVHERGLVGYDVGASGCSRESRSPAALRAMSS